MIGKLIEWSVHNRAMVVLLTLVLAAGGAWSMYHITVDAIPDLSDVQVVIRTPYAGQAPEIVEDQVTYPLTTSMLAVPGAETVRGYSMFGTSYVYIIFEDGTDMYWARSRVLEQLSSVAGQLPDGVTPQLGPDATGVGWIYQYVLDTGPYCPDHPQGLWRDRATGAWYADPADAPGDTQDRLTHHRIFDAPRPVFVDMQGNHYEQRSEAPAEVRDDLATLEVDEALEACPLTGEPLVQPDQDLADLRSLQDWYLRYELTAVEGVSEIASLGGFVRQYQVVVDPVRLQAYDLALDRVKRAIHRSNQDVGGRSLEIAETENMVRGLGYLGTLSPAQLADAEERGLTPDEAQTQAVLEDLRQISLGATDQGEPVYLADVAEVQLGPEIRRGVLEWNGEGETAGAIVVMRYGENALETIDRVKHKLADLEAGLPPGVAIRTGYDRSDLIERSVETLEHTLIEEILVVSLICVLFLLHVRSALVAAFVLPVGVLATLGLMYLAGINANIMSLGGIAISIGVMVDSSIVMVENAHKHLEREKLRVAAGAPPRPRAEVIAEAAVEVGPSLFFALLIIVVSFLPIFVLGGQSGRMFTPLAYTKTFAMAAGAVLAVTIIPVLTAWFVSEHVMPRRWSWLKRLVFAAAVIGGPAVLLALVPLPTLEAWRWWLVIGWAVLAAIAVLPQPIPSEQTNPISRLLEAIYNPFFELSMRLRWPLILGSIALVAVTWWPLSQLGSEFMPPLEEGDLLYMPTTTEPGLSITKAKEILQQTDKLLTEFPEVDQVMGKIGRAETATDPAPLNMIETIITLHRDKDQWRQVPVDRFYSDWDASVKWLPAMFLSETRPITQDELVYGYTRRDGTRVPGMNETLQIPGLANSWTMPIKTRIDMLSTGIKTPIGIKVMGPDLQTLAEISDRIAQLVRTADGTADHTTSAFAEKTVGGSYLDIRVDRQAIARHGLQVQDVQDVVMSALGGMNVTQTVEGLERYPVNVRYPRELRDNVAELKQVLVKTPGGAHVPLGQLATFERLAGPPMVKTENARPTAWVFVDIAGIDVGTYVERAQAVINREVELPPGYSLVWSGQYQYMQEARERLMIAVPLAGAAIVLLLYLATRSWLRVGIVILSLPFSLVGAVWLLYLLDYNLSMAVWVGMIALAGLAAETGLVMLLYLDSSFERFRHEGRMRSPHDLWHAVQDGAVKRVRPKTMTVMATFFGLLPLLWASGAGADTMRRLAVPMIGGVGTAFILELLIFPAIFYIAKSAQMRSVFREAGADADASAS